MNRYRFGWIRFSALVLVLWVEGSLPARGDSVLNFPLLSFQPNVLIGTAFVNPSDSDASVTITAFARDGSLLSGPGFVNPSPGLTVPARQQVSKLLPELFSGSLPASSIGWFQATSTTEGLTGFFLYLDGGDTFFDGADLPLSAPKIVFNQVRVGSGFSTELNILNPGAVQASLQVELAGGGADPLSRSLTIPPRGMARLDAATFFGVAATGAGAYATVTADTRIAGFESIRSQNGDLLGLNAKPADEQLAAIYLPQIAVLGPWTTEVGVVNYSTAPAIVTLSAYRPNGTLFGPSDVRNNPVTRQLPAGASLRESITSMFGFTGNATLDGWLKVESTTAGINGYVSYGAGASVAGVAAAPQGVTSAIFSHLATSRGFFNGVAVLNPGSLTANVRILAIRPNGQVLGSYETVLQPGQRLSQLIDQLIPQAGGMAGGLIWVRSDQPIYAIELFGTANTLANVPAQSAPDSYRPDSALQTLTVTPPLAPVEVGKSQRFQASNAVGTPVWKVNGITGGSQVVGVISAQGLYSAPAAVPAPQSLTVTAETASQAAGASVDVLKRQVLASGLGVVQTVAYLEGSRKLFSAELLTLSTSQANAETTTSSLYEISPAGSKTALTSFSGETISKMIPYLGASGTEYLLLAAQTTGRIIRFNPATRQAVAVVSGLNQPSALVLDPATGNLIVAEADTISVISAADFQAKASPGSVADRISSWELPRFSYVREDGGSAFARVPLIPATAGGVTVDSCTGDIYFSDAGGVIRRFLRRTGQILPAVAGLRTPGQMQALHRAGFSCPGSFQLLVVERGAGQVSLLTPANSTIVPWVAAPGISDVTFLPKGNPFAPGEGVLTSQVAGATGEIAFVPTPDLYSRTPVNPPSVPTISQISDPVGDVFGSSQIRHDITSFSARVEGTALVFRMTFSGTISSPVSGRTDALVGYIDMDTDQNSGTGQGSSVDIFSAFRAGLGVDYYVSFFPGQGTTASSAPVYAVSGTIVGGAVIALTSNSLTITVPLSVIKDDGIVNTATIIGTTPEPTDIAPNGGFITSAVASGF